MRSNDFHARLLGATFAAMKCCQQLANVPLSLDVCYGVALNQSHDANREADELIYPEDNWRVLFPLTSTEVADLLVRDGRVPQWIDVSVEGISTTSTFVQLLCCGRYHDTDERLYYYDRGTQPFGIKSPSLPSDWKEEDGLTLPDIDATEENLRRLYGPRQAQPDLRS
jgi:hypothetical protein